MKYAEKILPFITGASILLAIGFCVGAAYEQWQNQRISKAIPDDPWALHEVRPGPLTGE